MSMRVVKTIQLHSRVPLDDGPPENVSVDNTFVGEHCVQTKPKPLRKKTQLSL